MNDFLTKPFERDDLFAIFLKWLARENRLCLMVAFSAAAKCCNWHHNKGRQVLILL